MGLPSPRQQRARARIEAMVGLAAPFLDLLLAAGDRVSRIAGSEDDYVPIRPASERLELESGARRALHSEAD
jgi:hypothetical protein